MVTAGAKVSTKTKINTLEKISTKKEAFLTKIQESLFLWREGLLVN